MTTWVRLGRENDWGTDYYAVHPLDAHGTADRRRGIRVVAGESVQVRFADGAICDGKIVMEGRSRPISDMGHDYVAHSQVPRIEVDMHGQAVRLNLDEVDLPAEWVESRGGASR